MYRRSSTQTSFTFNADFRSPFATDTFFRGLHVSAVFLRDRG
jgi:hypothetical protein